MKRGALRSFGPLTLTVLAALALARLLRRQHRAERQAEERAHGGRQG